MNENINQDVDKKTTKQKKKKKTKRGFFFYILFCINQPVICDWSLLFGNYSRLINRNYV